MPELPEVETVLRGIQPAVTGRKILDVVIRNFSLRWPVPADIRQLLCNRKIVSVKRRAKYLLFAMQEGTLILHLGMSGSLRILHSWILPGKHDHADIELDHGVILRYTDPRRFGAMLWTDTDPGKHFLLKKLGPEPLTDEFTAEYLWKYARNKKTAIKFFLMDGKTVAGIGNIYAAEALFEAGIFPHLPAGMLTFSRANRLVTAIRRVLKKAVDRGGTTLKDFTQSNGRPGYFSTELKVYGRAGLPCLVCKKRLQLMKTGQRTTTYCDHCQK